MTEPLQRVVKKDKVRMAGVYQMDVEAPSVPQPRQAAGRILEQRSDGAVIEVTCACGRTIRLDCAYAASTDQ